MADRQRSNARSLRGLGAVLVAALCLSGCSIKLAYNNADRLIRWGIDDYVDFEKNQRAFLDGELKRLLYWHRTTQLPVYTGALRRLEADIAAAAGTAANGAAGSDAVLQAQFRAFIETALSWAEAIQAKGHRTGSQMLVSLTAEQISELPEKLAKENREFAKEEAGKTLEQNQDRWAREVRKGLKRFTGRLSPVQKAFVEAQSRRYEPEFEPWVRYRERWQADLLALLNRWAERSIQAEDLVAEFRSLTDRRESYYGDFAAVRETNETLAIQTMAGIFTRMSEAQAQRFSERVLGIVEDLEELVEEAAPEPPAPLLSAQCLWPLPSCPGERLNAR